MTTKQKLIDERIVLMHKVDDIDKALSDIAKEEMTVEDKKKLAYYKTIEKDNPVPEEFANETIDSQYNNNPLSHIIQSRRYEQR